MIEQDEEPDVVDEPLAPKSGLIAVIVLSIMLGAVFAAGVVGVYWHLQARDSMRAEVKSVRAQLTEKSLALDETKTQVEALSRQIHALREHSIARSGSSPAKAAAVRDAPAMQTSDAVPTVKEPSVRAKVAAPSSARKNARRTAETCELAGKSPEEQAATLKRCVELIDAH